MEDLLTIVLVGGGVVCFFAAVLASLAVESKIVRRLHAVDRERWMAMGRPCGTFCLDLYEPPFDGDARMRLDWAIWRWALRLKDPLRDDVILRRWSRVQVGLVLVAGLAVLPLFRLLWNASAG